MEVKAYIQVYKRLWANKARLEIRVWHISEQETVWRAQAHRGIVQGVCAGRGHSRFLSCSTDKTVRIWDAHGSSEPVQTYYGKFGFTGLSHHRSDAIFATSGNSIDIWDEERSEPIQMFEWGSDSYQSVKFNYVEKNILASCGSDRTITLYDIRTNKPLSKLVMTVRSIWCWILFLRGKTDSYIFTP